MTSRKQTGPFTAIFFVFFLFSVYSFYSEASMRCIELFGSTSAEASTSIVFRNPLDSALVAEGASVERVAELNGFRLLSSGAAIDSLIRAESSPIEQLTLRAAKAEWLNRGVEDNVVISGPTGHFVWSREASAAWLDALNRFSSDQDASHSFLMGISRAEISPVFVPEWIMFSMRDRLQTEIEADLASSRATTEYWERTQKIPQRPDDLLPDSIRNLGIPSSGVNNPVTGRLEAMRGIFGEPIPEGPTGNNALDLTYGTLLGTMAKSERRREVREQGPQFPIDFAIDVNRAVSGQFDINNPNTLYSLYTSTNYSVYAMRTLLRASVLSAHIDYIKSLDPNSTFHQMSARDLSLYISFHSVFPELSPFSGSWQQLGWSARFLSLKVGENEMHTSGKFYLRNQEYHGLYTQLVVEKMFDGLNEGVRVVMYVEKPNPEMYDLNIFERAEADRAVDHIRSEWDRFTAGLDSRPDVVIRRDEDLTHINLFLTKARAYTPAEVSLVVNFFQSIRSQNIHQDAP